MSNIQVSHFLRSVGGFAGAYALVSENDKTDTAVIFVHGFCGDARTTWLDFQSLIDLASPKFPWWQKCDAYFYEYNSVGTPIAVNADRLLFFVDKIFPHATGLNIANHAWLSRWSSHSLERYGLDIGTEPELPYRSYHKLIFVGHSEGAVIIRRAVIQYLKAKKASIPTTAASSEDINVFLSCNPLFDARLFLFGPAYFGASCSGWMGALLHLGILSTIIRPILSYLTAYVDLQKGSPVLESVRKDTEHFASVYQWASGLRAQAVFGDQDKVVYLGEYQHDPPALIWKNHDHVSICKPHLEFDEPLRLVRYDTKRKSSGV